MKPFIAMYILIGVVFSAGMTPPLSLPFHGAIAAGIFWPLLAPFVIANVAEHTASPEAPQSPEE